ncbi:MAG TPA: ribbon-helix-helix domain-containing protein [Sphingomicrobium sp.]|jgi:predicted DNA-binding ribbon-helix-helix protein|nr:ribbon-helix-helix domain-containing protein [Sphingomicrobium sp.]
MAARPAYGRPVKRSVTIAGHQTSISLEPIYWQALERAAAAEAVPLNALIARVDSQRHDSRPTPSLTSALRQWLLREALGGAQD